MKITCLSQNSSLFSCHFISLVFHLLFFFLLVASDSVQIAGMFDVQELVLTEIPFASCLGFDLFSSRILKNVSILNWGRLQGC